MDKAVSGVRFPLYRNAYFFRSGEPGAPLYLQHGGAMHALQGHDVQILLDAILPQINGTATEEEIVAAATRSGISAPERIAPILQWLMTTGICGVDREAPGEHTFRAHYQPQIQHFGHYVSYPTTYQKRLQTSRATIIGLEYLGTLLVHHLAAAGVGHLRAVGNPCWLPMEAATLGYGVRDQSSGSRHTRLAQHVQSIGSGTQYEGIAYQVSEDLPWVDLLADSDLTVLALPRYLPAVVRAFNQAGLAQGNAFFPLWIAEDYGQVGPLVLPHETACLYCLYQWQHCRWHTDASYRLKQQHATALGSSWAAQGVFIPWVAMLAAIAAGEVITTLTQYRRPASQGHALCVNLWDWRLQPVSVFKIPHCPDCSRRWWLPTPQPATPQPQES